MTYSRLELNSKVAVVIGGTSGIGLAIAKGMAEAGADVVPTSRRPEQVESAASDIESRGRKTLRISADVSDRASLQNVLDESIKAFGKVDILVNSAGRTKRAPTLEFTEEDWNNIIDTNLTGTLRAAQVFGRHMLERKYGSIINIASLSTFVALYEVAAYSASKAAVASLTKSLAIEWSQHVDAVIRVRIENVKVVLVITDSGCPNTISVLRLRENAKRDLVRKRVSNDAPIDQIF